MDIYNTTNDIEATQLRKNLPNDKGFPVWLVITINTFTNEVVEKKLFVTIKARDCYISSLSSVMKAEVDLLKIQDVKSLFYEVD